MTTLFDSGYPVVDRSTLERYASCPAQARFVDDGQVRAAGLIAASGSEVHNAISKTITSYIDQQGTLSPSAVREMLEVNLRGTRPDVQPDAIKGFRASTWAFADYLANIHFQNVLHWDGGKGEKSGQLAFDFDDLQLRVTSEVDLLHTTAAPDLLAELDWKSGWKMWSVEDVRDSFQFGLHAFLILKNYEAVKAVRIAIWNTRMGKRTWPTEFTRGDLPAIEARIRAAAGFYLQYREMPPELAETWPVIEKCQICPAAHLCPAADKDAKEISENPAAFVDQMVAVGAKYDAMVKIASKYVDKNGDIVTPSGAAFGTGKPKAARKPTKTLYKAQSNGDDDSDE